MSSERARNVAYGKVEECLRIVQTKGLITNKCGLSTHTLSNLQLHAMETKIAEVRTSGIRGATGKESKCSCTEKKATSSNYF